MNEKAITLRPKRGRPKGSLSVGSKEWLARWEGELPDGRGAVLKNLLALPSPNEVQKRAIEAIQEAPPGRPLATILKSAGIDSAAFIRAFQAGQAERQQQRALLIANSKAPDLALDLTRHAIDQPSICHTCGGELVANLRKLKGPDKLVKCWGCNGKGTAPLSSKHKKWAADKLLEITKLVQKGPQTQVNVNNQQAIVLSGGAMEKIASLGYKALRSSESSEEEPIIDVFPPDSSEKSGEAR